MTGLPVIAAASIQAGAHLPTMFLSNLGFAPTFLSPSTGLYEFTLLSPPLNPNNTIVNLSTNGEAACCSANVTGAVITVFTNNGGITEGVICPFFIVVYDNT